MFRSLHGVGQEFRRVGCVVIMDEISSLSIKILGSLMTHLTSERIQELTPLVEVADSVMQKELSSFKRLFRSYKEMISSTEKEVFLKYIK